MLKISREVELGLLLVVELGRGRKLVRLKDWAEERGLPYRFLSKVAVKLKKAGLLKSKEGRRGGYSLGRKADKIVVGELVRILGGGVEPVRCLSGAECGCEAWCGHREIMGRLGEMVEGYLSKLRLADIC